MKIVIIGTGNVATVFGDGLKRAGHRILQVFGRTETAAKELAGRLDALPCSAWNKIDKQADLYLVAIADKALVHLHQELVLTDQIVVHTAGSVTREVLRPISANYGVFYPLQTLKRGMPVSTQIPLLVDANNEITKNNLLKVAAGISGSVMVAGDEQRLKYHVAAVFVNNFTNHLYTLAESYCQREGISFPMLFPLAAETTQRLQTASPTQVATGPAVRNDHLTIEKHLELLSRYPPLQTLYADFTKSIRQWHQTD